MLLLLEEDVEPKTNEAGKIAGFFPSVLAVTVVAVTAVVAISSSRFEFESNRIKRELAIDFFTASFDDDGEEVISGFFCPLISILL